MAGSVWEHTTGLRIHLHGLARLPDGQSVPWRFDDEYDAKRQQGYNVKRAIMVWALSLLSPNGMDEGLRSSASESTTKPL